MTGTRAISNLSPEPLPTVAPEAHSWLEQRDQRSRSTSVEKRESTQSLPPARSTPCHPSRSRTSSMHARPCDALSAFHGVESQDQLGHASRVREHREVTSVRHELDRNAERRGALASTR